MNDLIRKYVEAISHRRYARLEEQARTFLAMGYGITELMIVDNRDTGEVGVYPKVMYPVPDLPHA